MLPLLLLPLLWLPEGRCRRQLWLRLPRHGQQRMRRAAAEVLQLGPAAWHRFEGPTEQIGVACGRRDAIGTKLPRVLRRARGMLHI
jgi:hypothetical protein